MVTLGLVSACSVNADSEALVEKQHKIDANIASYNLQFQKEYQRFTSAYFIAMENKQRFTFLLKSINKNLSPGEHLSSAEQIKIEKVLDDIQQNWVELSNIALAMDAYDGIDSKIVYDVATPTTLRIAEGIDWLSYDLMVSINPNDELGQLFIARNKLWLAARVTLFDAYLVNLLKYTYKDDTRRQFDLSLLDKESGAFVESMYDELIDQDKWEETLDTIEVVDNMPNNEHLMGEHQFLNDVLAGSYAYQRLPKLTNIELAQIATDVTSNQFQDSLYELVDDTIYVISQGVGNTVGMFESREGKLKLMPTDEIESIVESLEPLDILFEKTPFRLTDSFIPGHWGHVAIWVGGKKAIPELKRLDVWDELPKLEAYARTRRGYEGPGFQEAIQQDQAIVEALRDGVEINTLNQFLNIDDLAVIRANNLSDEKKRNYLLHTFAQIGKPYDFNFDVETNNEIVCSELIFEAYSDIDWPVEEAVGRYTISPDNVAALAVGHEALFRPTLIYHDGQRLPKKSLQADFERLLEQNYTAITQD